MFGMSAGTVLSAVAPAVIGGLMGGSDGANSASQSTQNQLDPNLMPYLYGSGGLLGGVNSLYQQQMGQGGMNPMQTAGLEMQRQTLMNPAYTQGFDQMRSVGEGLMGGGVAGNPFSQQPQMPQQPMPGRVGFGPDPTRMNSLGFNPMSAANQPIQQAMAAPAMGQPQMPVDQRKFAGGPYFGYKPGDPIGGIA